MKNDHGQASLALQYTGLVCEEMKVTHTRLHKKTVYKHFGTVVTT